MEQKRSLPAEWYPQSAIMVTWPLRESDWGEKYDEITRFYIQLISVVSRVQKIVVLVPDEQEVKKQFVGRDCDLNRICFCEVLTNDTWVRDYGAITVWEGGKPCLLDFQFNAWGLKFAADKDNQVNGQLPKSGLLQPNVSYESHLDFVLEGGSIESDGAGTLLTTRHCLFAPNRNANISEEKVEEELKKRLGVDRILWLHHGALEGDDTDGHVDTLARFCAPDTIAYVQCSDASDTHYASLVAMEQELKNFRDGQGNPYRLLPLPLPAPIYEEGRRLPATYANFLIMNEVVLCPTYRQPELDVQALQTLSTAFPNKKVIGIDCMILITQNGSLHCSTMQFPQGVF